jgi:hypothetical protein
VRRVVIGTAAALPIEVQITDGHYWDTKHGKMVSLMKIAVGVITGKQMDDGVEGNVRP